MSPHRFALAALASTPVSGPVVTTTQSLNVSYDPTRGPYQAYNVAFIKHWKAQGNEDLTIQQSYGGSGEQARAVIDRLKADVVTLALTGGIDELRKLGKLLPADWQARLPDNSTPYISTIVFLVRKSNPKGIKDWGDPTEEGVEVVTPNPKTSSGACWNFLAAQVWAKKQYGDDEKAKNYVQALYRHVPALDTDARGSTITFVNNQIGDVLLVWENEAFLTKKEQGGENFEIVVSFISILAKPLVVVVDKMVKKKGTRKVTKAYLQYLYSEEGQRIAARNFYRPRNQRVAAKFATQFLKLNLVAVDSDFGGWKTAQPKFFNDGGISDQIYQTQ